MNTNNSDIYQNRDPVYQQLKPPMKSSYQAPSLQGSKNASSQQFPNQPPFSKSNKLAEMGESTDVTHSCILTEKINPQLHQLTVEHLDLSFFKSQPCKSNQTHNHKHCPYYHSDKDRKRPGNFYSADLCEYVEKQIPCPFGDQCQKSHNRVEQLYQPEKYKTKFCSYYPNNVQNCDYGSYCSFAHSENDIIIELIHNLLYDDDFYMFYFKTVWCPFNLTQHDKALCVYAHNWQDYRRKPNVYHFDPIPCPNWKANDYIINYQDGCINGFQCKMCHGWKELEYHPRNYKVKACPKSKACEKGIDCPFYHSQNDRRVISQNIHSKIFRFVPKNRIITNTFKVRSDQVGLKKGGGQSMFNVNLQTQFGTSNTFFQSSHFNGPHQQNMGFTAFQNKAQGYNNQNIQQAQQQLQHTSQVLEITSDNFNTTENQFTTDNQNWISQNDKLNDSFELEEQSQNQPSKPTNSNSVIIEKPDLKLSKPKKKKLAQSTILAFNQANKNSGTKNTTLRIDFTKQLIPEEQNDGDQPTRKKTGSQLIVDSEGKSLANDMNEKLKLDSASQEKEVKSPQCGEDPSKAVAEEKVQATQIVGSQIPQNEAKAEPTASKDQNAADVKDQEQNNEARQIQEAQQPIQQLKPEAQETILPSSQSQPHSVVPQQISPSAQRQMGGEEVYTSESLASQLQLQQQQFLLQQQQLQSRQLQKAQQYQQLQYQQQQQQQLYLQSKMMQQQQSQPQMAPFGQQLTAAQVSQYYQWLQAQNYANQSQFQSQAQAQTQQQQQFYKLLLYQQQQQLLLQQQKNQQLLQQNYLLQQAKQSQIPPYLYSQPEQAEKKEDYTQLQQQQLLYYYQLQLQQQLLQKAQQSPSADKQYQTQHGQLNTQPQLQQQALFMAQNSAPYQQPQLQAQQPDYLPTSTADSKATSQTQPPSQPGSQQSAERQNNDSAQNTGTNNNNNYPSNM